MRKWLDRYGVIFMMMVWVCVRAALPLGFVTGVALPTAVPEIVKL